MRRILRESGALPQAEQPVRPSDDGHQDRRRPRPPSSRRHDDSFDLYAFWYQERTAALSDPDYAARHDIFIRRRRRPKSGIRAQDPRIHLHAFRLAALRLLNGGYDWGMVRRLKLRFRRNSQYRDQCVARFLESVPEVIQHLRNRLRSGAMRRARERRFAPVTGADMPAPTRPVAPRPAVRIEAPRPAKAETVTAPSGEPPVSETPEAPPQAPAPDRRGGSRKVKVTLPTKPIMEPRQPRGRRKQARMAETSPEEWAADLIGRLHEPSVADDDCQNCYGCGLSVGKERDRLGLRYCARCE